jgi:predicted regulator of Ras-like GTPase activity (Roadblock/LC7/MglB family)
MAINMQDAVQKLTSAGISMAAILGQDGSVWGTAPGFQVSADEVKQLLSGIKAPDSFRAKEFSLSGTSYALIRIEQDRTILGKKGDSGATVVKTKKGLLVAVHKWGADAQKFSGLVQDLADFLISSGY